MKYIRSSKEKRTVINIVNKVITIISSIIALLFMFFVYKLNFLTFKYIVFIYGIILIIYAMFYLIIFNKKIKDWLKKLTILLLIILSIIFLFGMHYVDKTSDFLHSITGDLNQTEEYFVKVLNNSKYKIIDDLESKKIGAYIGTDETTIKQAIDLIEKKIEFEFIEYSDINLLISDLKNGVIDAIIINELINNLIHNDLNSDINLKIVYSVLVNIEQENVAKNVDVTNSSFNVYVAGGDAFGTINKVMNTDVNMVVSVDPINKKILLTSIPRDYYVNLPSKGNNAYDKLTHAGYYGIQESILAVEELLDIEINYYVKVNFSTIVDVIDAIGGIEVYSDYAFKEQAFGVYTYKVGINKLNGEQALAFARERYSFKDGDIQRVKNQQKVLSAIIDKVTSSTVIITNYLEILESISDSFTTNMETKSMNKLVKMQLNDMATWNVEMQNLIGGGDLLMKTYTFPNLDLYVMQRNEDSINEIKNNIKNFS